MILLVGAGLFVRTLWNLRSVDVAGGSSTIRVGPDGRPPGPKDEAWVNDVGSRFFETMGIPILAGRSFDVHDTESSPPVVVVSERFVREFFANQSPVGRTVRNGDTSFQIVGVCGDIRFGSARAPAPPVFYRHFAQAGETGAMLLMILREVSSLTAVGTIVGLLGAAVLARYVEAMLFGVTPTDPAALAAAVGVMMTVALAAGWLPGGSTGGSIR